MRFLSICSGIEAASVAWSPLGWEAVGFSEIEPFPSAVLAHHYPNVPNFGDMNNFEEWEINGAVDVVVGGTPCQAFSFAGQRRSLDDERGNLTLTFCRLCDHFDPEFIIWENVPGVLNTKDNAFGCFLGKLAGGGELKPTRGRWGNAGYIVGPKRTIAWRVLDAQYFGLAQRRKRVFLVASAREDICPAEILFEFDGVRRDAPPSREAGKEIAGNVGASAHQTGFRKLTFESYAQDETASTMMARDYKSYTDLVAYGIPGNWIGRKPENGGNSTQFMHEVSPAQTATDKHGVVAFNSRQDPVSGDVFGALDTSSPQAQAIAIQGTVIGRKPENGPQGSGYDDTGVCFTQTAIDRHAVATATVYPINTMTMLGRPSDDLKPRMGLGIGGEFDPQNTLSAAHCHAVATATAVRRLTPVECERLQGFPDNYTRIPWRNKPAEDCPDGPRYKALGNSMAVPVMRWIGKRIEKVNG